MPGPLCQPLSYGLLRVSAALLALHLASSCEGRDDTDLGNALGGGEESTGQERQPRPLPRRSVRPAGGAAGARPGPARAARGHPAACAPLLRCAGCGRRRRGAGHAAGRAGHRARGAELARQRARAAQRGAARHPARRRGHLARPAGAGAGSDRVSGTDLRRGQGSRHSALGGGLRAAADRAMLTSRAARPRPARRTAPSCARTRTSRPARSARARPPEAARGRPP
jgi:hypothetical protein